MALRMGVSSTTSMISSTKAVFTALETAPGSRRKAEYSSASCTVVCGEWMSVCRDRDRKTLTLQSRIPVAGACTIVSAFSDKDFCFYAGSNFHINRISDGKDSCAAHHGVNTAAAVALGLACS